MKTLLVAVLALMLGVAPLAHAQIGSTAPIYLSLVPEYPRPGSSATVTVRSDTLDLYSSSVTVTVNGAVVEQGSGVVNATFTVGAAGQATNVVATVVSEGRTYTSRLTINPSSVALILEPLTTSHPFYEGGSLVASEGALRVVALPDLRTSAGIPLSPESLVYTWRIGNRVLQAESGIGKNILRANAPIRYRDAVITVTVTPPNQSTVAQSSILITPVDPIVRVYRNDPLLGVDFANALTGTVSLRGTEDGYRAVPYFFAGLPSIAWSVNGTVNETSNSITLRATGEGEGTAQLAVEAQNSTTFQRAENNFLVKFGEASGFNFLGL